jgi:hypothetical protein
VAEREAELSEREAGGREERAGTDLQNEPGLKDEPAEVEAAGAELTREALFDALP